MPALRPAVVLFCAAAMLSACNGLYTNLDGGSGGGSGGSGGAGGTGGAGGSAGSGGSGGSGGTGGSGGAGGTGGGAALIITPLDAGNWLQAELVTGMSVPEEYDSIAGLSANSFWVGDSAGRVWAYASGTWTNVYTDSNSFNIDDLYVSATGEVFAIADKRLGYCAANCSQPGTFQVNLTVTSLEHLGAVCGGNGLAFAIVGTSTNTVVQVFRGGAWSQLTSFAVPTSPESCSVLADGTLIVTGQDDAYRRDPDGGSGVETIPPPTTGASPYWWGTTLYNGEVWAAGQGRRIARRSAAGVWSIVYEGTSDLYRFHALHASGGTLVATGDESTIHTRVIVENGTLGLAPNPDKLWGRGVFVSSPNEHIVVGYEGVTVSTGKMYRMTR